MAFYDFMQKLVIARQIKFERGKIELLGQKLSIFPTSVFATIIENNKEIIPDVYKATKDSALLFGSKIRERHNFTNQELKSWLSEIIAFAGWGIAEFFIYDDRNYNAVVRVRESTIAGLYKKAGLNDHALRGFFSGGGTASMDKNLECLETKCISNGDKICEFVLAEKSVLKKKYPELFENQLWWLNNKR